MKLSGIRYKGHFIVVVLGWFCIIATIVHDIIFALRYDMMVPKVTRIKITTWKTSKGWESFFPFCCLFDHQPVKWIPLWQDLLIYIPGAALIWFIITLFWFWREKGLWQPSDKWDV